MLQNQIEDLKSSIKLWDSELEKKKDFIFKIEIEFEKKKKEIFGLISEKSNLETSLSNQFNEI